jgi:hypothetical protein
MDLPTPDEFCSAIAARQFGLITRAQALRAGLTPDCIKGRLGVGRWEHHLPLVYALAGSPETWEQRAMGAQLWAGPRAALSPNRCRHLGLRDGRPLAIDVVTNRSIRASGVRVHRSPISSDDVVRVGAFVVTTGARTMIDLAGVLDEERLETCLEQALYERLLELPELDARLKQVGGKGRKGAGVLHQLLDLRDPGSAPTESEIETLLFRVLRKAHLPLPERQHSVWDDREFVTRIDFAYPEARIAIPVDSYKWHSRRRVWEKDIERRARLQALDWRVRPTTSGELRYQPERFTADVARLLRLPWPEVCSATGVWAPFSYIPGDSAPRQDDRRSLMYFVSTGNSVYRTMAPTATGRAKMTSSLSRNVNARPAPAASADHMYNTMTA